MAHQWFREMSMKLSAFKYGFVKSRSQSWVPDFYSTFKSKLLDFKSGKSDLDSTPPGMVDPFPQALLLSILNDAKSQSQYLASYFLLPGFHQNSISNTKSPTIITR